MILSEGKTKRIIKSDKPHEIIIETKDDLTGGDAAKKETIQGIAVHKTTQTVNVFKLLERHGIPTAFIRERDATSFVCADCDMLPLECVMRRYAWGSFLKREPGLTSTIEHPHRFSKVVVEFFHKHAVVTPPLVPQAVQMDENKARALYLKNGKWANEVYTDPLIQFTPQGWQLHSAKIPVDAKKPLMTVPPLVSAAEIETLKNSIMIPVFEAIEKAWAGVETVNGAVALVDMKIEVGRRKKDGKLVLADVIDNDSWRIWPGANPSKQLDKQCFREDHPLVEVAEKYELVASLTSQFQSA